ncbi:YesL family protein [Bacillus sp. OVS6]|nr:YesL family protein [Bacillus sp. OVS6]
MLSYDGTIMRALAAVGNYCLLNLLWIVFSLPIITVFPATVAMFGILKEWSNGSEQPVLSTFFSIFKKIY